MRAEYIRARLNFASADTRDFVASGWYFLGAKFVVPKLQSVVMYAQFDPDLSVRSSKDVRQTTIGLNYYIRQSRLKGMAGYVIRQERLQPIANNLFQVQFLHFLH